MSRPIDEKIVKMKLDNSDFKNKASATVGIFGKLNQAFSKVKGINLTKSVADLSQINSVASKTDMSGLINSLSSVTTSFSALGIMAMTVLSNITTKALDAGINMVKSFTLDPIMAGFSEYELKMGSIQTILANTSIHGTTLDQVTASLDELNTYADKTIYNFGDMTKNIGMFTNAGIKVEEATSMIKGFSNEAASSGTTAEGAAGAAYQLSQALSAGTIRLMDWRSLQNVGMGSKKMQTGIIEIADAMGELEKNSTSSTEVQKDFNGSLEKNWLSADVMSNYLKIMAGDMTDAEMAALGLTEAQVTAFKESAKTAEEAATKVRTLSQLLGTATEAIGSGWTETMELLFGDFNEATEMFTKANDVIGAAITKSADARNKLIGDFDKLGGRAKLIEIISNSFKALVGVFTAVKNGFQAVFPPATAEGLMKIVTAIAEFTSKLTMSEETAKKVSNIFKGLFSILSIGITIAKTIGSAISGVIPEGAGGNVLDFVNAIADMIIQFDASLKSGNAVTDTIRNIGTIVSNVAKFIWDFASAVTGFLIGVGTGIGQVGSTLAPVISKITGFIGELLSSLNLQDVLNIGFIGVLVKGVNKIGDLQDSMGGFLDGFTDMFGTFKEAAKNLGGISDALEAMTTAVKVGSLVAIAVAVGLLALSMKLIAGIKAQDIAKSLEVIALSLILVTGALNMIGKLDFTGGGTLKATTLLVTISLAVMAMALALKVLSTIDTNDMAKSLIALVVIVTSLVVAIKAISNIGGPMQTSSIGLLALSVSVVILAAAVSMLSKIKATSLAKAVTALGVILLELAVFLKIANGNKLNPASAIALVITSGAILIMVNAIKQLGNMDTGVLVQGMIALTIVLAEMAVFVKMASGSKVMSAAVGMVAVAAAMNMMVPPIRELGSMDMDQLVQGLVALTIVMVEMVLAMKLASGSVGGAVAILLVANAIKVLVPPLVALSNLSIKQVAVGLLALAGAFLVIGVAAKLIGVVGSIGLVAFALALTAIGFAVGMVGVTILAFTAALTALAALTVTGIAAIVGALGLLLMGLVTLIPQMVNLVVTFVVEMAKGFAEMTPVLADSAGVMILGVITAMATYVPQFVEQGMAFLTGVITAFGEGAGPLIEAGVALMIQLIDGMATALEDNHVKIVGSVLKMTKAILLIIVEAMIQLVDVLFGWIPGVSAKTKEMGEGAKDALDKAFDVEEVGERRGGEFVQGIDSKKGEANTKGKGLGNSAKEGAASTEMGTTGTKKGTEFNTGVGNKAGEAKNKGTSLGNNAKNGAGSVSLANTGSTIALGFTNGVGNKTGTAQTKGKSLVNHAKTGAGSVSLRGTGQQAGEGFAGGVESKGTRVSNAASFLGGLAKTALRLALNVKSPSREMMKIGVHTGEGFAIGMDNTGGQVVQSAKQMANGALVAVQGYAKIFSDEMLNNMDLAPTITPILDLNNMRKFNLPDSFNVGANVDTRNLNSKDKSQESTTQGDTYNISIHATGDLSDTTIRKMANKFQKEIKNQNDRQKISKGEVVIF